MADIAEIQLKLDAYAAEPSDPYWIEGESFCRGCAELEIKNRPGALIEGGYCSEEDSCVHCHTCGMLLDYTLTDAGAASEVDHFKRRRFHEPLHREEAFHLARMLAGASDDPEAVHIAERAAAKIPEFPQPQREER